MAIKIQIPQKVINELRPYWGRRWVLICCAWVVCVFGWLAVASLQDRYDAMTRIYVETENLLTPLLRNIAVHSDIQKQLEVLQRTLLNRSNLAQVAHATDLDLDVHSETEKEQLYESIAKRVTIKAEGQNLFLVTFRDTNPKRAKKAVETLLNLFVETNLGQNRTSMENARKFLENQIQEYEQKLKQAEQRLAEYKSQHLDMISATGTNFASRVDNARQEQFNAKSKFDNAVVVRDHLRASLATTPQFLAISQSPQVVINNSGGTSGMSARNRVMQLRNELSMLQSRYTDTYPDVVSTKRALEAAEAELEHDRQTKSDSPAKGADGNSVSNPVYEQIKLRLVQAEADVAQAQIQLNTISAEYTRLQGLAESAPAVEADVADLNREYGVIKSKYEDLLSRRESARISEAVESSGDKVQFRIIEAPQVPSRPSFPNRALFATLVLMIGLGVGGAVIFLLHAIDDTVASTATLTSEFNVRVLGSVSRVDSPHRAQERRRNSRNFLLACASLFAAYLVVIVVTQLWQISPLLANVQLPSFLQGLRDYAG